ncbi:segregation and condensation protein A [Kangiella spongicola]|uniref:Segregation and condensation protein A n=1 Tax=Kangiella spongicola TaxID=796379 RepID=A0A318D886_9GAMM|nr:ScpA family protein [Kangiella spongicola]PXF63077.1 segregation/condensation protein A [Kangiella spongicola]
MTEQNGETEQQQQTEHEQPAVDHVQEEMPFALVDGEQVEEFPQDLYIPPDALEVFLEAFEGPLDLLLYLIKRQNVDIRDIPIAHITEQYMEYVELMKAIQLELAAEYLVMAAMLAEIKSRVLLPRPPAEDDDEEDPRADLIRRLQEYEQFKQAAEDIDELPRMGRDVHQASAKKPDMNIIKPEPEVDMKELLIALRDVLRRAEMFSSHQVKFEALSVRERMGKVLERLSAQSFTDFSKLFDPEEGRSGVVVTFLAIMELAKESLLEIIQSDNYGPIHVRAKVGTSHEDEGENESIDEKLAKVETTSDQA